MADVCDTCVVAEWQVINDRPKSAWKRPNQHWHRRIRSDDAMRKDCYCCCCCSASPLLGISPLTLNVLGFGLIDVWSAWWWHWCRQLWGTGSRSPPPLITSHLFFSVHFETDCTMSDSNFTRDYFSKHSSLWPRAVWARPLWRGLWGGISEGWPVSEFFLHTSMLFLTQTII